MKHKKLIAVAILLLGCGGLFAQEATSATGGEASGSGGMASYTVGQIVYRAYTGSNGSVSPALQQGYEIITIGISEPDVDIELSIYPNPTSNNLTLKVDKTDNLRYHLFNMNGELFESNKVVNKSTTVEMASLPSTTYFLKVTNNNQVVKTFKIIKN